MDTARDQLRQDTAFGFLDATTASHQVFHPILVSNQGANTMVRAITAELRRSSAFTFSVAFVTPSALAMLKQALIDFPGRGTIITSTYLGFNSPATFRELLNLPSVEVRVHRADHGGFHAKGYLFDQPNSTTAIIGSSNLTETALLTNHEWNLRFSALPDGDIVTQLRDAVAGQLADSAPLTAGWVDEYARTWTAPPQRTLLAQPVSDGSLSTGPIVANRMQAEALAKIAMVREAGERRAVVVSATGTGKTILAALDVRAAAPDRMLFVVHREQILDRAIEEFQEVLGIPAGEIGKFVGSQRQLDRRYVFGTVQSLSRSAALATIPPDLFDYVLVDEVHRAGARSYRQLLDRLTPDFTLGITATPERTDGFNVFEMFDFNVPYEIRLQAALEADMLAPFHYFGVTDFEQDGEVVGDTTRLQLLVAPERADHIVAALKTYGHAGTPVRGLMFCSRKDEAAELVRLLNERTVHGRRLRTVAVTGDDPIQVRERVVDQLQAGEVDYIVTVDVFNEGIDIPTVNQVVMLRQTQSSIVFTQQLGRGLRKAAGKDHLIVIDFIGNYTNNYLVPIALFGDSSLNKDSIRRRIIDAQEAGAISGLSSVNFDRISRDRILASIAQSRLDSMQNLKRTVAELEHRLGHPPRLLDFARFDTADPVVVAGRCKEGNYWTLLHKFKWIDRGPSPYQQAVLSFFSLELLNGKRPHELLLVQSLLASDHGLSQASYREMLARRDVAADEAALRSVDRVMSLEFFTEAERAKYREPVVIMSDGVFRLNPTLLDAYRGDAEFAAHLDDLIDTGLYLVRHRYRWPGGLEPGKRYSRKDVCRLLNWEKNEQSTLYGYKVDYAAQSCPIFITYHKHDEVTASTRYGDELLNESTVRWFSKSRRTLQSRAERHIASNLVALHVFVKKDDAEGTDFYYLGRARASDPEQTTMPDDVGRPLDVVTMTLGMESPIEARLYDYLVTASSGD